MKLIQFLSDKFNKTKDTESHYTIQSTSTTEIATGIRAINLSDSIEDKVLLAKELLLNTDVVLNGNALIQFDDDTWAAESNYLRKYLEYKCRTPSVYKGVDCDVSLLCVVMYAMLNEKFDLRDITYQCGSKLKYEYRCKSSRFKGDTLTSALWLLKLYLGCLWKEIDTRESLKRKPQYDNFYKLFDIIATTGVPKAPVGEWNTYCLKHSDTIWSAMDGAVKVFLQSYTMFGNYMCIPGSSYQLTPNKWTSFNIARSNMGKWDTVDTLLWKIYAYYSTGNQLYLKELFTDKKEELAHETLQWLNSFGDWNNFIDKNVLLPFVDNRTMIPISLKTGVTIKISVGEKYNAIPQNYQEFLVFFEQASMRIKLRSKLIYEKIHFC